MYRLLLAAGLLLTPAWPLAAPAALSSEQVGAGCVAVALNSPPDTMAERLRPGAAACADALRRLLAEREIASKGVCPASMLPLPRAAGAVTLYVQDHPGALKAGFDGVARTALQRFYPCRGV